MNIQWYVAKNGTVSGPLSLIESQKYVADNEGVYVWQANFMQWQAASQVAEFSDFVKESTVAPVAPKGLIEKFAVKKKRVYSKLTTCTEKFTESEKALESLLEKIETYKKITLSLSPAVQDAISTTEKRYHRLVNKVSTLTSVYKNAEEELIAISNDFENNSAAPKKTVKETPVKAQKVDTEEKNKLEQKAKDDSIALAMKSAEDEFLAKFSATQADEEILETVNQATAQNSAEDEESLKAELEKLNVELDAEEATSFDSPKAEVKSLFSSTKAVAKESGVKGLKEANKLFKQVFNPNEQEETVPLSQQLKQLPKEEKSAEVHDISAKAKKEEVVADTAPSDEELEGNKKRRRRR